MTDELVKAVARYTDARAGASPFLTAIEGLVILRSEVEKQPMPLIYKPSLCVVAQGEKWAMFGRQQFVYREGRRWS